MERFLDTLIEQVNPLEDHKRTNFQELFHTSHSKKVYQNRLLNFLLTSIFKPVVRGGIVGGFIGAGVGYLTGEDVAMYTGNGIRCGSIIDTVQYNLRGAYHFLNALEKEKK